MSAPALELVAVSSGYGEALVIRDVGFALAPGEIFALLGKNGNGKSTLAKLLAGKLNVMSGEVTRARKLIPGYFAQHQLEELDGTLTPIQTLGHLRPQLSEQQLRTQLGGFGFSADKAMTKVASLSGGERARLMLALATLDKPNLLILDEPTAAPAAGEIAGHLHPCARVIGRGKSVRRRCFAGDGHRLILPAFGAVTLLSLDAEATLLPRQVLLASRAPCPRASWRQTRQARRP